MRGVFTFGGDAAGFDAGAGDNPFVGCFDELGKVLVGENFLGEVAPSSCDGNAVTHGGSEGESGPCGKP